MKIRIIGILFFFSLSSFSQEITEIKMSDVKYEVNADTTSMAVSVNNILLNGKYKIINDKFPTRYVLTEFIDGKAQGESKSIHDGVLVGKK